MNKIRFSRRVFNKFKWVYMMYVRRDPLTVALHHWYRGGYEKKARYDFPLEQDSLVWDVGGFLGA
jgi:hypothetical protein